MRLDAENSLVQKPRPVFQLRDGGRVDVGRGNWDKTSVKARAREAQAFDNNVDRSLGIRNHFEIAWILYFSRTSSTNALRLLD